MPWAMARPRWLPSTGRNTAASLGPSSAAPRSGLTTEAPCTSWSYWRTIASLLHTLSRPSSRPSSSVRSPRGGAEGRGRPRAGREAHGRQAVVEEVHLQPRHHGAVVGGGEHAGGIELA